MRAIAAISTPHGKGGVALIRVSGEGAFDITDRVFVPAGGKSPRTTPRKQVYGAFVCDGQEFDDGLACCFPSPHSFTGEDVAELCCHGGVLCAQKLLAACIAAGAVLAGAGEFTRRAFIGGRLSLTRAEAVGELIDAKTDAHLRVALLQSRGALSDKLRAAFDTLTRITASVYAYIDYPTEDLRDISGEETLEQLCAVREVLARMCATHAYGKAISEGITTAIVGKPNVGKSSLLNLLAGEDRAIVTPIAGTTRDVVTERIQVGDIILDLSDTAGIRESSDVIESIGVEKSRRAIANSSLILAMFDASEPFTDEDEKLISILREAAAERTIAVMNKCDKRDNNVLPPFERTVRISALTGEGRDALERAITDFVGYADIESGEVLLGARQYGAVMRAAEELDEAINALKSGFTPDIALMNVENALEALGELDGRSVSEHIVNDIFSHFCVGK